MTLRSVVCFFAHPDDETVLAGGMINLLVRQQVNVHIVCATRGEGGETGASSIERHMLGSVRESELRCAAQALGATVSILDYVDPTIGEDDVLQPFEVNFDTLARQLATIAIEHKADAVLTHGADGEYGHPAHQLVHRAVVAGIRQMSPNTLIYTVAANVATVEDTLWNKNQPAHLALDIRPWAEAKLAAMACHATQHALFMRRKKLQNVRDALRTVESVRRVYPETYDEPPQDVFAALLRTAGAWTPA